MSLTSEQKCSVSRKLTKGSIVGRPMYSDDLALTKDDEIAVPKEAADETGSRVEVDFDQLFERYNGMVFNLAYQILGNREEALDVSQEVFLKIFLKIGSFRGESSLKTWIYCITVHCAANRLRWWNRLRRRGTVSLEEYLSESSNRDLVHLMKSNFQSPEETLLEQEEQENLEKMLRELPLQQRIAVVMRDIEGLSYEEIARCTNASLGTVKSRIARGREALKRLLQGSGN